jgi:hypothetical protein
MGGILGGSSSGGGSNNSASTSAMDPQIREAFLSNVNRATGVAQNLGTQQFAPRTGDYFTGQDIIRNAATNGAGMNATNYGANLTANAGNFNAGNIDQYVNPAVNYIAGNTMNELGRGNAMALDKVRGDAIANKAFGGSRSGIAEAETNRNFFTTAGNTLGNIYGDAYNNAANTALGANAQQLSAGQNLANIGDIMQNQQYTAGQNVGNLGMSDQAYQQAILDAQRNLPLEQQAVINQALGLNPAGGSGTVASSSGSGNTNQNSGTGLFGLWR